MHTTEAPDTVYVVDDDPAVLKAVVRLLETADLHVAAFASPAQFLAHYDAAATGCLVLDLALPGLNGLQLQQQLQAQGNNLPIVFLTGRGDIPSTVQAMKHGATDFLTKPVCGDVLIAAVTQALARARATRDARAGRARIADSLAVLTAREREVFDRVTAGQLNKQVAAELGTVERTIKFHRANLMHKLGVRTLADLVKLAERAAANRRVSD